MAKHKSAKHGKLKVFVCPKCGIRSVNAISREINKLFSTKDQSKIFNTSTSILIWRDPYNRLLSGYLNKYIEHNKYIGSRLKQFDTFEKFVREIKKHGIGILDHLHFTCQVDQLNLKKHKIDTFFAVKDMCKYITYINDLIKRAGYGNRLLDLEVGIHRGGKKQLRIPNRNIIHNTPVEGAWKLTRNKLKTLISDSNKKNQSVLPPYDSFYNNELRLIVRESYKTDFSYLESNGVLKKP